MEMTFLLKKIVDESKFIWMSLFNQHSSSRRIVSTEWNVSIFDIATNDAKYDAHHGTELG